MKQRMPVLRLLDWTKLIPQFIAIAVLAVVVWVAFPDLGFPVTICSAALIYFTFCRVMRAIFVRDHQMGMEAYHAQKFPEAISYFQASYQFFSNHRRLDLWRSLLFGVAGPNPYRIIALCNMAYCCGQIGEGQEAIRLYEEALQEQPGCLLAKSALKMLRSVSPTSETT